MAVQAQYPANVLLSEMKPRNVEMVVYKRWVESGFSSEAQLQEYQTVSPPVQQHPIHYNAVPNAFQVQNRPLANAVVFQNLDSQTGNRKRARSLADSFSILSKRPCLVNVSDRDEHSPVAVSTGLKLAFEEDSGGLSSSANSPIGSSCSILSSISEELRTKLQQQRDEMDHFLRLQEEQLRQSLLEKKQRFLRSFLTTVEEGILRCLREKELEMGKINRKNLELEEKVKQLKLEAQLWQTKARNHEVMVAALKNNLQHAVAQHMEQKREGFGDNEFDDVESGFVDPNSDIHTHRTHGIAKDSANSIICKVCCMKAVSVLLLPCRHLCLCRDCESVLDLCPLCHSVKNASLEVYM